MKRTYAVMFGILLALVSTIECAHADQVVGFAGGVSGVWFDGPNGLPSDFEVGGHAKASLSPHISVASSVVYGVEHSYLTGLIGPRITVSDPLNPNFSIGVGAQYRLSSKTEVRPQEWQADVSMGWVPWPVEQKNLAVVLQGSYGFDSDKAACLAGLRYVIGGR